MRLGDLIAIPIALILGYSGEAFADRIYEKTAVLKNGVTATFDMNLVKSECHLALLKTYPNLRESTLDLQDLNCDGTVDTISFPFTRVQRLIVRSFDYKSHKGLFDTADKLYNETVKHHKLREAIEKEMTDKKGTLEAELKNFFK